jgi:hypothetical protein
MVSKIQNIKCIDFHYSSIGWITKKDSLGIFKIDASHKEKKTNKVNYLANMVMAGNVYGTSILPIIPNYYFQWLTNGKKRIIFRSFVNKRPQIDKKNNKNIKKYLINVRYKKKKEIYIENLIKNYKFFNEFLVCRIDLGSQIIEFPINHINLHPNNYTFQVETGPILLKKKNKFFSAFIFFNTINSCQIVPYYPKLGGKIEELEAKIKFFINA